MNGIIDAINQIAPVVAICAFALPSYIGILKQTGWMRGLLIIAGLGLFAVGFETLAIKTGLPYGDFSYSESLGGKLFGTTPWVVALAYPPILLVAFWAASKFSMKRWRVILLSAVFATLIDLMLDPAMVALGFWQWDTPGAYYGVPVINFAGWLVSGIIGAAFLRAVWGGEFVGRSIAYSGIAILLFWTGANLGVGYKLPAILGAVQAVVILIFFFIERQKNKHHEPA